MRARAASLLSVWLWRTLLKLSDGCVMGTLDSDNDTQHSLQGGDTSQSMQEDVNAYFDSAASYWDEVYRDGDLQGLIYQQRQTVVLNYVDAASLQPEARVLEIGCGAGHLTARLAERELRIEAVDSSPAMVETTARRAREQGLEKRVTVGVADVHALPFESSHFDLVIAVGVIPWLHSPADAVQEMARVLRRGGGLVLTADNRARLSSFTDPRAMLSLSPFFKRLYHAVRKPQALAMSRLDSPRRVDGLLVEGGLRLLERRTVGFGPFSFLGRMVFSDSRGVRIDQRLQALADRGVPGLKWTGWHYVVRAVKA
jgi:ubiquinone/menaquinone biosynthesis C-methylase UbiE